MLSTKTIIYIVIAVVILLFIYKSMKSEGFENSPTTKIPITSYFDLTSQLKALENKIKSKTENSQITVTMKKINYNQYQIEFNGLKRVDLPAVNRKIKDLNIDDSVSISVQTDNNKFYSNIDINPELKAIRNANPNIKIYFEGEFCKGCKDKLFLYIIE